MLAVSSSIMGQPENSNMITERTPGVIFGYAPAQR